MKKIPERIGTQGWQSFLASKHEMLYQYRLAQKYSKSHTVETFHGNVAEAVFRGWLANFLPKRYAVTSGYVISQKTKDNEKMPHFDVIIYDQIESPILWHEGSPDSSEMGVSRAIPAEYVVSIFEVKSSFEPKTVKEGVVKLQEVEHLLNNVDESDVVNKTSFPQNFCCGLVFFELREKNMYKIESLENLMAGTGMRGYFGALILEGEKIHPDKTAQINIVYSKTAISTTVGEGKESLFDSPLYGKPYPELDGSYLGAMITWGEANFARFMFDQIAFWKGTFRQGFLSSLHGISYMNPERKKN